MVNSVQVTRVEKRIKAPLKFAYDWCTDYREDDHEITGSIRRKVILEKTAKKAVYIYLWDDETGKQQMSANVVSLKHPGSWHLDSFGKEQTYTGDYKLIRINKDETRLVIVFKHKWKEGQRIQSVAEQEERLAKMWDKYVAALESDHGNKGS